LTFLKLGLDCFVMGDVAIDFKNGVAIKQLHPAVYGDFSTILADVAKFAGPLMRILQLRAQLGKFDWKFGLQQSVAVVSNCFAG